LARGVRAIRRRCSEVVAVATEEPAVEFVTAAELRELDADPVLDRADYWREGGRP